jgi:hypothetical protein
MPRYEGMTGLIMLGLAMMVIGGLVAGLCTLGGVANFAKWGDSSLLAIAITGYIGSVRRDGDCWGRVSVWLVEAPQPLSGRAAHD